MHYRKHLAGVFVAAAVRLAEDLCAAGKFPEAEDLLRRALASEPGSARLEKALEQAVGLQSKHFSESTAASPGSSPLPQLH